MRAVFQWPASMTSVVDAPRAVSSDASPTRPLCAVTRAVATKTRFLPFVVTSLQPVCPVLWPGQEGIEALFETAGGVLVSR